MKQRITYLVKDPDTFTPEKLEVKDGSLTLDAVEAVKEHRITFGLDELPAEFRDLITQYPALHLKWISSKPYSAIPPFTSRGTPGLHILFSPPSSQDALCPLVHIFGSDLKCSSVNETATPIIHVPSAPQPDVSLQYFSHLSSLDKAVSYIKTSICHSSSSSCKTHADTLLNASYLDIDYDAAVETLILTAFYDARPTGWTERIPAPTGSSSTEVGVLAHEPNPDPEDIAFGGFLTVLGRDTAPKPTRFQTPTSHPPLPPTSPPLTYTPSLQHPTGLHPTLRLLLPRASLSPPDPTCTLHIYLTLPSALFLDRHQYTDALALSARNLLGLRALEGATDLEAPEWVVGAWGSSVVLDVRVPEELEEGGGEKEKDNGSSWAVDIPLHLRYLPAAQASHARVAVPWPVVFWACASSAEGEGSEANPFARGTLGWEGAFEEGTRYMQGRAGFTDGKREMVEWVDVPVLDTRRAALVEGGTVGVVVLAFMGLCWVLFGGGKKVDEGKKKQ